MRKGLVAVVASAAVTAAIALGGAAAGSAVAQSLPEGYPADYKSTVDAATKEGKVVVYSSTDAASAEPVLQAFRETYPGIQIEYNDLNTSEIYSRFISEVAAKAGTGDLLWSSAMDLQIKLVAEGNALTYASPESAKLPKWAVFKDQAWGTTLEPVVMAYNKRLLPADKVPKTHADLAKIVKANASLFSGKLTAYDPEKSGVGFLLVSQDSKVDPNFWDDVASAFGGGAGRLYTSTGAMLERISSGEHILGYNMIGSYVRLRQKKDADLGMVMPQDYTLGFSRIAFISKEAKQPNAAKLFLDFILSKKAQEIMANKADLYAVRDDVSGEATPAALKKELGDKLKPIPVDSSLLEMLEPAKRLQFLRRWQQAVKAQ
ncbi:MAG TPA: ABC transporter substrate-binding protein [Stellaceae bacterium]|jgi:iron(III) transport system substrate-binding protein